MQVINAVMARSGREPGLLDRLTLGTIPAGSTSVCVCGKRESACVWKERERMRGGGGVQFCKRMYSCVTPRRPPPPPGSPTRLVPRELRCLHSLFAHGSRWPALDGRIMKRYGNSYLFMVLHSLFAHGS